MMNLNPKCASNFANRKDDAKKMQTRIWKSLEKLNITDTEFKNDSEHKFHNESEIEAQMNPRKRLLIFLVTINLILHPIRDLMIVLMMSQIMSHLMMKTTMTTNSMMNLKMSFTGNFSMIQRVNKKI